MEKQELEYGLEERSKNYWWLCSLFLLASTPSIFNSMHITAHVYLSENPKYWCDIPVLRNANWTDEQIRNVSAVNPQVSENCLMYKWDYENFKKIGYEEALKFMENNKEPSVEGCTKYRYKEEKPTIVSQWDLVCENSGLKSLAEVAVALGKFLGAFVFGIFADKFGRKKCFTLGCFLYIIAGPVAGFAQDYYLFLIMRLILGIAGSGVYENGYTILTELTVKRRRTQLGSLFSISYSIGLMILPILAYISNDWRQLQYYLSFPAIFLLIHCWYLPESPRWLITQGRFEEAKRIIFTKKAIKEMNLYQTDKSESNVESVAEKNSNVQENHRWYKKLFSAATKLFKIYSTSELRKRILICYFGWFVSSMSYFVIALNANNFTANKYLYVALNGVCEAPSYFALLTVLAYIGRKLTGALLFNIAGIALIFILFIQNTTAVMIVALLGRFCVSGAFALIMLHTSELFPTSNRNSAVGTSLTMAQLGAIVAPFIVDILGNIAWYIPSTLCGITSVMAGLLILMLPETRNKPLPDHLQDLQNIKPKDRVSWKNCFTFA